MTYLQYLLIFLVTPLTVVIVLARHRIHARLLAVLGAICVVAIVYTAPWDSAIIQNGVWSYRSAQVLGVVIAHVPLEEYVFYVLQTMLVGMVTVLVLARRRH